MVSTGGPGRGDTQTQTNRYIFFRRCETTDTADCLLLFEKFTGWCVGLCRDFETRSVSLQEGVTRTEGDTSLLTQLSYFKLLLFTYKALNGLAPIYISELLEPYRPPRLLRSAQRNLLKVPNTRTKTYGNRAFSQCCTDSMELSTRTCENC